MLKSKLEAITHTARLRDLVANTQEKHAANATMAVADAVQKVPSQGAQLMGLACAFSIAAEEAGLPIPDLIGYAKNCMNHGEGRRPEFSAVTQYIQKEIIHG